MVCENCGSVVPQLFTLRLANSPKRISVYACAACRREKQEVLDQVNNAIWKAKKLGLPHTLTRPQWLSTRRYFHSSCAYCGVGGDLDLEHFIPFNLKGGSTFDNCIPSCERCNRRKWDIHPDLLDWVPKERMDRIRTYIERCRRAGT